jgi:CRP-like cAMP-binding protein
MTATQAIRELIEGHLRTIDAEVVSLREALERLENNETQRRAGRRKPRRRAAAPAATAAAAAAQGNRRTRAPRAGRSPAPAPADIATLLASTEGLTTTAIAERAGLDRAEALSLLKDLESKGEVRRSGQRRGVRWHAYTDEDRIRERAAELEKASRAAQERRAA